MPDKDQNGFTPLENHSKLTRSNHSDQSNISNIVHQKQADSLTGFKIWYAISLAFQLGFLIVVPIGGFMLLGLWGDNYFHTAPLLLITGVVVGVIITAYEVYHLLSPLIRKND